MFGRFTKKDRIYLDYAAATPVHPRVRAAMEPYFSEDFANAGAIHQEGQVAATAISNARLSIARALVVREEQVFFTASGTESNNLAIRGHVAALLRQGRTAEQIEIISTALEHPSVLAVLEQLVREGVTVHYAPVNEVGQINVPAFVELLSAQTALVTTAYANSEIGVLQPVRALARAIKKHNEAKGVQTRFHLDASQAPLWLSCQVPHLGVDMLTLDAGKCEGPKGVGILIALRSTEIAPVVLGGGQENGLRAGTENTPLIVGAATAIVRAQERFAECSERIAKERDALLQTLEESLPRMVLNGPAPAVERIANNINFSIPGFDTEFAVTVLDRAGIAASTKSACSGNDSGASQVVLAISGDAVRASSTIRLSLGPDTSLSIADQQRIAQVLHTHTEQMSRFDFYS